MSAARNISPSLRSLRWALVSRRVHAALTALAFVAASLLGVLHEATTAHERCAVHGELVDSDGPLASVAVPVSAHDSLDGAQSSARGHGDEHCLMASALRASRIAPRAPALAVATVTVAAAPVAAPSAPRVPVRVFRIAPKTSPPV